MLKLNLGSGGRPLKGFENLDKKTGWFYQGGLPQYSSGSVDAITISHSLMYLTIEELGQFMEEAYKVLKNGGLIRITEDDTENPLSRQYQTGCVKCHPSCLTGPKMMRESLEKAGFKAFDVDHKITHFADKSLMQAYHGGAPHFFFMEGIKNFDKTVLYYTSNREDRDFEKKIQETLIQNCGDLPIISVSQKPTALGKNICVGDVGHSYLNAFRQILIGAKEAETEYLVFAEADFLYPAEYFTFNPPGGNLYKYDNVWLVFKKIAPGYRRKKYSNGAQIAKCEFVIKELEDYLLGQPEWIDGKFDVKDKSGNNKKDYNGTPFEFFSGDIACVSFKTENGVTKSAVVNQGEENKSWELPYWGDVRELRKKYL